MHSCSIIVGLSLAVLMGEIAFVDAEEEVARLIPIVDEDSPWLDFVYGEEKCDLRNSEEAGGAEPTFNAVATVTPTFTSAATI